MDNYRLDDLDVYSSSDGNGNIQWIIVSSHRSDTTMNSIFALSRTCFVMILLVSAVTVFVKDTNSLVV